MMTCVQLTILSTQSHKFLDLFVGVLKFYLNGWWALDFGDFEVVFGDIIFFWEKI